MVARACSTVKELLPAVYLKMLIDSSHCCFGSLYVRNAIT
uniref:Uncharacterized protein n=1 Tax=Anguilla anguilla TaxID=7936 RepID=A0A0E9U471_ANGAN